MVISLCEPTLCADADVSQDTFITVNLMCCENHQCNVRGMSMAVKGAICYRDVWLLTALMLFCFGFFFFHSNEQNNFSISVEWQPSSCCSVWLWLIRWRYSQGSSNRPAFIYALSGLFIYRSSNELSVRNLTLSRPLLLSLRRRHSLLRDSAVQYNKWVTVRKNTVTIMLTVIPHPDTRPFTSTLHNLLAFSFGRWFSYDLKWHLWNGQSLCLSLSSTFIKNMRLQHLSGRLLYCSSAETLFILML